MTTQTQNLSELVAENVRALMARTKTKQSGLADVLHMTQGAVSKKVNGDRPFSLDEIDAVADFFGVPVQSLFDPPRTLPFPRRVDLPDADSGNTGSATPTGGYHTPSRRYLAAVA